MDKNVIKFTVIVAIITALSFAAQARPAAAQSVAVAPVAATTLAPISTAGALSYEDLERRISAQGFRVSKAEVRDLLLKVTAYDQQHRKVKMTLDRRSGEVLAFERK